MTPTDSTVLAAISTYPGEDPLRFHDLMKLVPYLERATIQASIARLIDDGAIRVVNGYLLETEGGR